METFHLHFAQPWPLSVFRLDGSRERLPEGPGAYALGAADRTSFQYPWGTSPVFYIGQSDALEQRLGEHRKYIEQAIANHYRYWWPRYQYGAAFGAVVAVYPGVGGKGSAQVEKELVEEFWEMFGAIPVANSAWPRSLPEPIGKEDDA